jgi:hypothetical protein
MPLQDSYWVKLQVGTTKAGEACWVACLRRTAEFYGWADAFPPQAPPVYISPTGRRISVYRKADQRLDWGGKPLRISRAITRKGNPAGLTNRFRVSRNWTLRNSAALAQATTAEWSWMEGPWGGRRSREQWLAMAAATLSA